MGISPDPIDDVKKFSGKFKLNFPLLADADAKLTGPTLYWNIGYATAVLQGDWKLIVSQRPAATVELYNLAEDPGETKNLANTNPGKVEELRQVLARQKGLDP